MKKYIYTLNAFGEEKKNVARKDIVALWGLNFVRRWQRRADNRGKINTLKFIGERMYEVGIQLASF